jgi:hypothetical protein
MVKNAVILSFPGKTNLYYVHINDNDGKWDIKTWEFVETRIFSL